MPTNDTKKMDSIGVLTVRLLLITLCAGLILGFVYTITKEPIAQQDAITANASRMNVLPAATEFKPMDISAVATDAAKYGEIEEVYQGVDAAGQVVGYTMAVRTTGYSPNLCLTIGIGSDGIVTGVDVSSHAETPGLGANATSEDFRGQFVGTDGPLTVVKTPTGATGEIEALTGSTITSRAVTNAVNLAREFFEAFLAEGK